MISIKSGLSKLTRTYKHRVYPKIQDVRGATLVRNGLQHLTFKTVGTYDGVPKSMFRYGFDNLIILDACRYDLWKEAFPEEEMHKRISLGSSTAEFVEEEFSSGDYSDYVYVTGNPHFSPDKFEEKTGRRPENVFHEVFHTYETDWLEDMGRPSTEAIVRDAKTAEKLFPDKKLVVHFMKPHHPFSGYNFYGFNKELKGSYDESVWAYAERGELDWSSVWNAYKYTLEEIKPIAENLAKELDGETLLTSDHGNFCGEAGMGHHPANRKEKPLREVPMRFYQ